MDPKNNFREALKSSLDCKKVLFYEARTHCRHKTILDIFLVTLDIESFKNKTFEEVYLRIQLLQKGICKKGSIGPLTVYDIAADISRYHGKMITKVSIIGSGPKRAIKLLGIKPQLDKVLKLHFVSREDVCTKLNLSPPHLDGDILETYLCQWQKNV